MTTLRFDSTDVLAAARRLLADLAIWLTSLFDEQAEARLLGERLPENVRWDETGGCGERIEQATVLLNIPPILACLNTGKWNGDPDSFRWALKELHPFYSLVRAGRSIEYHDMEPALDAAAIKVYCQFHETAVAYAHLDNDFDLSLPELAKIAGLAEKTVRMAAIGRNRNPELVTFKKGPSTLVEPREARRWLKSKGINSLRIDYRAGTRLPLAWPSTAAALGSAIRSCREAAGLTIETLASRLAWRGEAAAAYHALEGGSAVAAAPLLSPDVLIQIGKQICPEETQSFVQMVDHVTRPLIVRDALDAFENQKGETRE